MRRIVGATFLSGLAPGVVAPGLWPVVVVLTEGRWPDWSTYPIGALTVSLFAIMIALPCCLSLGVVSLLALEKVKLNTPPLAGALGVLWALVVYGSFALINDYPPFSQAWPLAAFFAVIGVVCGIVASVISRRNTGVDRELGGRATMG